MVALFLNFLKGIKKNQIGQSEFFQNWRWTQVFSILGGV
jgi:hypothetical protein